MPDRLPQLLSVCMTLPTAVRPEQGVFVSRRLGAIAEHLPVRGLRPAPWFPGLRGGSADPAPADVGFPIDARRMFYLPGVAKWLDGRWMERCVARWVGEQPATSRPTLLDAHFAYPEGVAVHRVAKRFGLPFLVTLRGVEEEWLQVPRVRGQIVAALQDASGLIAVSESLRSVAAGVGIDPARIRVIGNGWDTCTFRPGCKLAARRQIGIGEDAVVLVTVANLRKIKGHDLITEALRQIGPSTDFEWHCVGAEDDRDHAQRLRRQIDEAGLASRVRFHGSRSPGEVAEFLRAADAFVLGSRREGSCNAILEALACGTPVVATAVGEAPSLAQRYRGIRVVKSDDPRGLADALTASLRGQIDMPTSFGGPMPSRTWADVAGECLEVIRETMRSDQAP